MIKEYLITYEKKKYTGHYFKTTTHQILIPAPTLFDAVDYAHNALKLEGIKDVRLLWVGLWEQTSFILNLYQYMQQIKKHMNIPLSVLNGRYYND